MDYLKVICQYLLPQHTLTRLLGRLAGVKSPPLKNWAIKQFIKRFNVNMDEAQNNDPLSYPDFNHFFIRPLKPELRPVTSGNNDIASPVDGTVDQYGAIKDGHIFHAKRSKLNLCALLGMKSQQKTVFDRGHFINLYLSPKDYHRVHMPFPGQLSAMRYIPGKLFSVQPATVAKINGIFTRNERVVSFFQTEFGQMAVILVGAMIVGKIHLNWHGDVNGHNGLNDQKMRQIQYWDYSQSPSKTFNRGDEIGHFKLGSTVIILFNENMPIEWCKQLSQTNTVHFGQLIAQAKANNSLF